MSAAACTFCVFGVRSLRRPLNTLSFDAPRLPAVARRTRRQRRIETGMGSVRCLHLVGVGLGNAE